MLEINPFSHTSHSQISIGGWGRCDISLVSLNFDKIFVIRLTLYWCCLCISGGDSFDNYGKPAVDRISLPTAPRAALGPKVSLDKVPTQPPFTAYLGNLPYDVNEEDIERFFKDLKV